MTSEFYEGLVRSWLVGLHVDVYPHGTTSIWDFGCEVVTRSPMRFIQVRVRGGRLIAWVVGSFECSLSDPMCGSKFRLFVEEC